MITLPILIPTALPPLTLQHSFFLKPPTPLPNSSMMLPLLPFLLPASTAQLKPGGLLKSQMPLRNAEKHLQRHTVPKTARTISPLLDIPPLWYLRLKLSHGRKLALAFLLKPVPVKSSLYLAPSPAPPPQLPKLPYPCRLFQPYLFTSTVPFLYSNPKTLKHRESSDESYQNCTLQHPALHFLHTILFSWTLHSHLNLNLFRPWLNYLPSSNPPSTISTTLLYIFNLSWLTHTFPSTWKQSTIIPILKPEKPSITFLI